MRSAGRRRGNGLRLRQPGRAGRCGLRLPDLEDAPGHVVAQRRDTRVTVGQLLRQGAVREPAPQAEGERGNRKCEAGVEESSGDRTCELRNRYRGLGAAALYASRESYPSSAAKPPRISGIYSFAHPDRHVGPGRTLSLGNG